MARMRLGRGRCRVGTWVVALAAGGVVGPQWEARVWGKVETATWKNAVSGSWGTGANWSGNDAPNNGFPKNTDYVVVIGKTGAAYVVTLSTADVAINSLSITSSTATLRHTYGALITPTVNLSAGAVYELAGGTLRNATVSGAGLFRIDSAALFGELDNVTMGADVEITGQPGGAGAYMTFVRNGLDLANGATVTMNSGGFDFFGTQTFGGTGEVVFDGTSAGTIQGSDGALTIGAGIHVRTGTQNGYVTGYHATDQVINYGRMTSGTGRTLVLDQVVNRGVVEASNGGSIDLYRFTNAAGGVVNFSGGGNLALRLNWSSAAPINVTNSNVELGGTFTTASMQTISRSGSGSMIITGTMDNTGKVLALDAMTGAWPLYEYGSRGTVKGGVVTALNPGGLVLPNAPAGGPLPEVGGAFESVVIDTNVKLNDYVSLVGDVTLNAGRKIAINGGTSSSLGNLWLESGARLQGSGEVVFEAGTNGTLRPALGSGTIGPGITVRTGGASGIIGVPNYGQPTEHLTLQGTVSAQTLGQVIRVQGFWTNTGIFEAKNGGNLLLTGQAESLGTLSSAGGSSRITLAMAYDNTEKTLNTGVGGIYLGRFFDGFATHVGTITGGRVTGALGVETSSPNVGGILDGVTAAGTLTLEPASKLTVRNGLTLDSATVRMSSSSAGPSAAEILFDGTQTLGGTGEVTFEKSANAFEAVNRMTPTAGSVLTIGPGVTVRNVSHDGVIGNETFMTGRVVNQGTIVGDAVVGGTNGIMMAGSWRNEGVIHAKNAAVTLAGEVATGDLGNLVATSGQFRLAGVIDNTGVTLAITDTTRDMVMVTRPGTASTPAQVIGGTITTSPGRALVVENGLFTGVTVGGLVQVNGDLRFAGGLTVNGTLSMGGAFFSNLDFSGVEAIGGTGEIAFQRTTAGYGFDAILPDPGAVATSELTLGPGLTIRSGIRSSRIYGGARLTHQSTSWFETAGNLHHLSAMDFRNSGTINVTNGATLGVTGSGAFSNTGIFSVSGGGKLTIQSPPLTRAQLGNVTYAGGTLELLGDLDNTGGTLGVDGTLLFNRITGGTVAVNPATGNLVARSGATLDSVRLEGAVSVPGGFNVYGLEFAAGATMSLTSGTLNVRDVGGRPALSGPGTVWLNNGTQGLSLRDTSNQSWTIGPNVVVRTGAAPSGGGGASFLNLRNKGTIVSETTNHMLSFTNVVNEGTIEGKNGAGFYFQGASTGTLKVGAGSTMHFQGTWSSTGSLIIDGGSVLMTGTLMAPGLANVQRTEAGGVFAVNGLLNAHGATVTLDANSGNLRVGNPATSLAAVWNGGTLATSGGAAADVAYSSKLDGVTINGQINVAQGQTLTLDNLKASTAPGRIVLNQSTVGIAGTQTLGGPIEVVFNGNTNVASLNHLYGGALWQVGPGAVVRTGDASGRVSFDTPIYNYGTLSAETAGRSLQIYRAQNHGLIRATGGSTAYLYNFTNAAGGVMTATDGGTLDFNTTQSLVGTNHGTISADGGTVSLYLNWTNTGTISAVNRSKLFLSGNWTNAGQITVADSEVSLSSGTQPVVGSLSAVRSKINLGIPVTVSEAASFVGNGNSLFLVSLGVLDNTGNTLDLTQMPLTLAGGTIKGGTLTSSNDQPMNVASGGLTGVTVDVPVSFSAPGPGFATLSTSDTAFTRPVAVAGSGARLTMGGTWSNTSSLSVDGGAMILSATGNNTGSFTLTDALLDFASFTNLGNVTRTGGTARFVGTLENAGQTFDPNATALGPVVLGPGARVSGGTLASASPIQVNTVTPQGSQGGAPVTFDGVTLAADVMVGGTPQFSEGSGLSTLNGLTFVDGATVTVNGFKSLRVTGSQSYTGSGAVVLAGGSLNITTAQLTAAAGVTLGPGITLRTGAVTGGTTPGQIPGVSTVSFRSSTAGTLSLRNEGLITSEIAGRTLSLSGGTFTNAGTIRAANGGAVSVVGTMSNVSAPGTLTGGRYEVYANSTVNLPVSITANGGDIYLSGPNSNIPGLTPLSTNFGKLTLTDGRAFSTQGPMTNTGEITLGPAGVLKVNGDWFNTGTVTLDGGTLVLNYTLGSPDEQLREQLRTGHVVAGEGGEAVAYFEASLLGLSTYAGVGVDETTLLTMLTVPGDANLDGRVGTDDYALVDRSMAMGISNAYWTDGDFDYDGVVGGGDYLLMDRSMGLAAGVLSADLLAAREARFGAAYVGELVAAVPEPGGGVLVVACGAWVRRGRRGR